MRLFSLSSIKLTSVVLAASLLTACGFHLRGDYSIPDELETMSLTSYDQYSMFTRMVRGQLRMSEVTIVTPAENIPNLHLLGESVGERTLSLYQNTRAAEKELTFNASYRVTIPEIGSRQLSTRVTRSYLDNPLTALAKSVERDMIEDEMRKLAATQIIRQMARLKADIKAGTMLTGKEVDEQKAQSRAEEEELYRIQTIENDSNSIDLEQPELQQPESQQ